MDQDEQLYYVAIQHGTFSAIGVTKLNIRSSLHLPDDDEQAKRMEEEKKEDGLDALSETSAAVSDGAAGDDATGEDVEDPPEQVNETIYSSRQALVFDVWTQSEGTVYCCGFNSSGEASFARLQLTEIQFTKTEEEEEGEDEGADDGDFVVSAAVGKSDAAGGGGGLAAVFPRVKKRTATLTLGTDYCGPESLYTSDAWHGIGCYVGERAVVVMSATHRVPHRMAPLYHGYEHYRGRYTVWFPFIIFYYFDDRPVDETSESFLSTGAWTHVWWQFVLENKEVMIRNAQWLAFYLDRVQAQYVAVARHCVLNIPCDSDTLLPVSDVTAWKLGKPPQVIDKMIGECSARFDYRTDCLHILNRMASSAAYTFQYLNVSSKHFIL